MSSATFARPTARASCSWGRKGMSACPQRRPLVGVVIIRLTERRCRVFDWFPALTALQRHVSSCEYNEANRRKAKSITRSISGSARVFFLLLLLHEVRGHAVHNGPYWLEGPAAFFCNGPPDRSLLRSHPAAEDARNGKKKRWARVQEKERRKKRNKDTGRSHWATP